MIQCRQRLRRFFRCWLRVRLLVDRVDGSAQAATLVTLPAALDVTGTFQFPHGLADGIDAFPIDLRESFQGVVPIVRQRQHLREQPLGFEGKRMVAEMVVGHDRVTFVFLDTEYRHFCDLLRLGFRI